MGMDTQIALFGVNCGWSGMMRMAEDRAVCMKCRWIREQAYINVLI